MQEQLSFMDQEIARQGKEDFDTRREEREAYTALAAHDWAMYLTGDQRNALSIECKLIRINDKYTWHHKGWNYRAYRADKGERILLPVVTDAPLWHVQIRSPRPELGYQDRAGAFPAVELWTQILRIMGDATLKMSLEVRA